MKKIYALSLSFLLFTGCSYTAQPTITTDKNVIVNYNEGPSSVKLQESAAYILKAIGTLLFIGGLYALSNKYNPENNH